MHTVKLANVDSDKLRPLVPCALDHTLRSLKYGPTCVICERCVFYTKIKITVYWQQAEIIEV